MPDLILEKMAAVESIGFIAKASLVSGYTMFKKQIELQHEYMELLESLVSDGEKQLLLRRVAELSSLEIDPDFRNPMDVPIAAYLLAIEKKFKNAIKLSSGFAKYARNLFWADLVAQDILDDFDLMSTSLTAQVGWQLLSTSRATQTNNLHMRAMSLFVNNFIGISWSPTPEMSNPLVALANGEFSGTSMIPWRPRLASMPSRIEVGAIGTANND